MPNRNVRVLAMLCAWLGLALCPGSAAASSIVVVQGTLSTPNAAEGNYSRSVSDRLVRLLTLAGLAPTHLTDDDVLQGKLAGHKIALLAYNPNLPPAELKQIQSFVSKGGRLMVFYSADPALAALMGVAIGTYASDARAQSWCAMRFSSPDTFHVPERVRQRSTNIRPVSPITPSARVIAYWEDAAGRLTKDAAWVASAHGFWMSHVLLDDGDTEAKGSMLVGLLASIDQEVWRRVAEHLTGNAVASAHFASDIRRRALSSRRSSTVLSVLDAAEVLRLQAVAHQKQGRFAQAVPCWRDYNNQLLIAYGGVESPAPDQFRGVWEHSGLGLYPGDWDRTCAAVKDAGLSDVLTNVSWPGKAHYASTIVPRSGAYALWGDQLQQAVAAAHRHGLKVHAWKVCWRMDGAPESLLKSLRAEGRLQVNSSGDVLPWLCPSDDRNLMYEKDIVRELLRNYEIDGIHLDYIRYPDSKACFCKGCRQRFESVSGRRIPHWPKDATPGGAQGDAYSAWRVKQITRLVRDVHAIIHTMRPQAQLSAAVYGRYPLCIASVAQDWGDWLKRGYLDFVCPMNYANDIERFASYTAPQLALPAQHSFVYPGIGVTATESRLDAVGTIEQIKRARDLGARGFTLYELTPVLEREVFPIMKLGVTRRQ
ncbi:MAG: family 10 glycosylhydrolase [Verrucomicrobia bacterium]|nr:family 10 glycosylhydrolase [Verrucomicrobiota bacterium]